MKKYYSTIFIFLAISFVDIKSCELSCSSTSLEDEEDSLRLKSYIEKIEHAERLLVDEAFFQENPHFLKDIFSTPHVMPREILNKKLWDTLCEDIHNSYFFSFVKLYIEHIKTKMEEKHIPYNQAAFIQFMKTCFDGPRSQEIIQSKLDDAAMFECLSQKSNNGDLPIEYFIQQVDEIGHKVNQIEEMIEQAEEQEDPGIAQVGRKCELYILQEETDALLDRYDYVKEKQEIRKGAKKIKFTSPDDFPKLFKLLNTITYPWLVVYLIDEYGSGWKCFIERWDSIEKNDPSYQQYADIFSLFVEKCDEGGSYHNWGDYDTWFGSLLQSNNLSDITLQVIEKLKQERVRRLREENEGTNLLDGFAKELLGVPAPTAQEKEQRKKQLGVYYLAHDWISGMHLSHVECAINQTSRVAGSSLRSSSHIITKTQVAVALIDAIAESSLHKTLLLGKGYELVSKRPGNYSSHSYFPMIMKILTEENFPVLESLVNAMTKHQELHIGLNNLDWVTVKPYGTQLTNKLQDKILDMFKNNSITYDLYKQRNEKQHQLKKSEEKNKILQQGPDIFKNPYVITDVCSLL